MNESVPLGQLRARVRAIADMILEKNPVTVKAANDAFKRVIDTTYDNAEDYLVARREATNFLDPAKGRKEGVRQFIDEKSYRPGPTAHRR